MSVERHEALLVAHRRAQRWLSRPGVVGVGIGLPRRNGRWASSGSAIVVKVEWKLERSTMRALRQRPFPRELVVKRDGRTHRIRVDVIETCGAPPGTPQGLVAAEVAVETARGAVGAVVSDAAGATYLVIAGHVAGRMNRDVDVGGVRGTTLAPFMTSTLDHCLVVPTAGAAFDARLVDGGQLRGVLPVDRLVPGKVCFFHHASTGTRTAVQLRRVQDAAPFRYPNGTRTLRGLVVTEGVTADGDSGTLLYDGSFRAVATLVGRFSGESYFIPCETALAKLRVSLVT